MRRSRYGGIVGPAISRKHPTTSHLTHKRTTQPLLVSLLGEEVALLEAKTRALEARASVGATNRC
jgi:hypothetical protein